MPQRTKFDAGDFSSVSVHGAIDRLRDIVGFDIDQKHRSAINDLTQTRNAFTHYGHTALAYAVEAQIIRALGFLIDFIPTHLYDPRATDQFGLEYKRTMEEIQERLGSIDSLVNDRMRDVNAELKDLTDNTVLCPHCRQYAVVVPEHEAHPDTWIEEPKPHCRFCTAQWSSADLARLYLLQVIGPDNGALRHCSCSEYEEQSLVIGASTAAEPDADMALCFRCGAAYYRQLLTTQPESDDSAATRPPT